MTATKTVVSALKEDIKAINLTKAKEKQQEFKQRFNKKRVEVEDMFCGVKELLA